MIEELKKYIREHKLHEKAIEYFWVAFNNWKKDSPKDYAKKFKNISDEDLDIFVQTVGLRSSQWPDGSYDHVTVSVLIQHKDSNGYVSELGKYVVWYPLSEEVSGDDFLEI